jgi:hypothetical protein
MAERVQLRRTRGWRMPANAIKVDRATAWGNPYKLFEGLPREEAQRLAVAAFRRWLDGQDPEFAPSRRATLLRRLPELRGRDLACWCGPSEECHADVLLELANR